MNYFYDTEFIEGFGHLEFISIGIVAEDGREYYAVSASAPIPFIHHLPDPWLRENVVPHLPLVDGLETPLLDIKHPDVRYPGVIKDEVYDFLMGASTPPTLWADFAAYDHVMLASLFGRMVDLPEGIPMWTHELEQLWESAQHFRMLEDYDPLEKPKQVDPEHHALHDARYDKLLYEIAVAAHAE